MTLQQAILELRKASGKSQQVMATELGMAIKTLQLYEQGRLPRPRRLIRLAAYADAIGRDDLTELFIRALEKELASPRGYELAVVFRRRERATLGGQVDMTEFELGHIRGIHGRKK